MVLNSVNEMGLGGAISSDNDRFSKFLEVHVIEDALFDGWLLVNSGF